MKSLKQLIINSPEYYLLAATVVYGFSTTLIINPIAIVLITIITLQLIFKNKTTGLILGCLMFIINIAFLAAVMSELNEFTTMNSQALKLISGGILLFTLNLSMSGIMIYKHGLLGEKPLIEIR